MALIICTECQKEFSDKAPACPNCGCPTNIVLEELANQSYYDDENHAPTVAPEWDIVATYSAFGHTLEVDEGFDMLLKFIILTDLQRISYTKMAAHSYDLAGNIDNLMNTIPNLAPMFAEAALERIEKVAEGLNIKLHKEIFFESYQDLMVPDDILEPLMEEYLRISFDQDTINDYHDHIRELRRNTWTGGGFGIGGSIGGYVNSKILNIGTSFLTAIPDRIRRANSLRYIRTAKENMYTDPYTKDLFIQTFASIYEGAVTGLYKTLVGAGTMMDQVFSEGLGEHFLQEAKELGGLDGENAENVREKLWSAFSVAPVSVPILEGIFAYGLEHTGDLHKYINDYNLLWRIKFAKIEDEILYADLVKLFDAGTVTNDTFMEGIQNCIGLDKKGYEKSLVDEQMARLIECRQNSPLTEEEYADIIEKSADENVANFLEPYKEQIKAMQEYIDTRVAESKMLKEAVWNLIEGIQGQGRDPKKSTEIYKGKDQSAYADKYIQEYIAYAEVPKNEEIWLVCKSVAAVLVLTDKGFHYNESGVISSRHYTYRELSRVNFTYVEYCKCKLNLDVLEYMISDLKSIVKNLKKTMDLSKNTALELKVPASISYNQKELDCVHKVFVYKRSDIKPSWIYYTDDGFSHIREEKIVREKIQIYIQNTVYFPNDLKLFYFLSFDDDIVDTNKTIDQKRFFIVTNVGLYWHYLDQKSEWIFWDELKKATITCEKFDDVNLNLLRIDDHEIILRDKAERLCDDLCKLKECLNNINYN